MARSSGKKKSTQEDVDNDHKTIAATADRMGLSGDERARYIHSHMTKFGHKARTGYVPGADKDDDDDDDGDEFFS